MNEVGICTSFMEPPETIAEMGVLIGSMQISRSTSPTIRVVLALALLLSVSAPLVLYVCGTVGGEEGAPTTELHQASIGTLSPCEYSRVGVEHSAFCDGGQASVPECTVGVCRIKPDAEPLALITEKPSLRLDLSARLLERISTGVVFSSSPVKRWSAETVGVHLLVPVRLLTSTFLL